MNWAKFYLAFENSLCDDYITEKFHNILENFNTVPVVMGPKKEDYLKVCCHVKTAGHSVNGVLG